MEFSAKEIDLLQSILECSVGIDATLLFSIGSALCEFLQSSSTEKLAKIGINSHHINLCLQEISKYPLTLPEKAVMNAVKSLPTYGVEGLVISSASFILNKFSRNLDDILASYKLFQKFQEVNSKEVIDSDHELMNTYFSLMAKIERQKDSKEFRRYHKRISIDHFRRDYQTIISKDSPSNEFVRKIYFKSEKEAESRVLKFVDRVLLIFPGVFSSPRLSDAFSIISHRINELIETSSDSMDVFALGVEIMRNILAQKHSEPQVSQSIVIKKRSEVIGDYSISDLGLFPK
ncbi:hypothetical protein ADUPG1_011589 [Aduncisulcus paluster]|uniref:Uncharacterized protein n=1 Tax=Aduncisulcus paluster TaxID=2918883 RepID=A0ABQ5JWA2_9EUKA|nr:hypothetical protein ADUPG1_011589 [Aduncisulcus paluster]